MSWPDLLIIACVILFAIIAMRRGFVAVLLSLAGLVITFVIAFTLYPSLAAAFTERFGWSQVWTKPLAFVALWALVETLFSVISSFFISRLGTRLNSTPANRALAILPGAVQGLVFAAVTVTVLALAPVGGYRSQVTGGVISGKLVQATLALERPLESIFGPAARQTLGLITVPPTTGTSENHEEAVKLNFNVDDPATDPQAEEDMLTLVNRERTGRGLPALEMDPELRLVARAHAADMFKRGYFAHETPEGKNPFDRMRDANIPFDTAGENLALAPTLDMAHDGLMNSPGHRANILNDQFGKVGIGVLDGGIYGKMFVQEFTD